MLDETIITETPPLSAGYGHLGKQVRIPITGKRAKRVLHGALNIRSGALLLLITEDWTQETSQGFLSMIRAHWRGWEIVTFEDRASQHTAPASRSWAEQLRIEIRWLPKATPELNAMDHLWRHAKRATQANRPPQPIAESAMDACWYLLDLSPRKRLCQAGVLSGNFWLT
jgi:DDE superfamily endonuclease